MSLSGQATVSTINAAGPTFDGNSGSAPSVPPATFTVITGSFMSSPPTAVTIAPTANAGSSASGSGGSSTTKVSTGVIVGIAVGVFAALALALVILMSIRHKRRMSRRPTGNRKSWAKLDDKNGPVNSGRKGSMTDVPMRAVEKHPHPPPLPSGPIPFQHVKAQPASSSSAMPIIDDHPYSRNFRSVPNPSSSQNSFSPNLPSQQYQAQTALASSQLKRLGQPAENGNNNIPNPFSSPSRSPSNSSAYHSMYHATVADHDQEYASALSNFPAVKMALQLNTVASVSDYPEDKTPSPTQSHYPDISSNYLNVDRHPTRNSYESLYEQYGTAPGDSHSQPHPHPQQKFTDSSNRSLPHKAIQDIITALDGKAPPAAWKDSNVRESSRLSMGEGLVDTSKTFDPTRQSHTSHMTAQTDDVDVDRFPLPPRDNTAANPFEDHY